MKVLVFVLCFSLISHLRIGSHFFGGILFLFLGMEYPDPKRKSNFVGKILMAATLTALCIIMLKQSPNFNTRSRLVLIRGYISGASPAIIAGPFAIVRKIHPCMLSLPAAGLVSSNCSLDGGFVPCPSNVFSEHEEGVIHVLVTGGAGYIGSHAALRLLKESYRVTIVDNLSRGNMGAVKVLQKLFPEPGQLQFVYADLGDLKAVNKIFSENAFDAVMHFAAVAYVGESTLDPLKYYHNITSNTLVILESMAAHDVRTLIYSSTCATYGEPEKMPITEETPQASCKLGFMLNHFAIFFVPINPYGKAKKMAEDIILDYSKNSDMAVMILRYFNVIGSDPEGRLGEAPRPELREHGRISGACFDAARGVIPGLKVKGTDYKTHDGTCIRDYIDVTDLVDAHVKALKKAKPGEVGIYNVGTGRVFSDPTKIRRELNWTAQFTDLQESLQIAWRWQKAHRDGYAAAS
ncbi:hypothetical protein Godav_004328 [Gossypium davidsonii]|uniref:NAD-dependent epimerase/dehydratase domain-containing protein n=1 Tax=Gossypium davidsonii TaxID=34287 RepID=A0A7J8SMG3_GOSDV|nr:hypothetical protein [Gossypium davidsonii]